MKYYRFLIICLLAGVKSYGQVRNSVDYPAYFAKQDLVFNKLSTNWEEGAFIGNGLLGAMVYLEDKNTLRFDLGRTDITDHREGINPSLGKCRLPIGKFLLCPQGKITSVKMRMNLWNAEISGTIQTDKGQIQIQALALATKDVFVVNTKSTPGEDRFSFEWKPELSQSPFRTLGRDSSAAYKPNPNPAISKENGVNFCYQPLLAGGGYTTAWKESSNANHSKTFYITIASTWPANNSKKLAQAELASISQQSQARFINAHRNKWHQFYSESFFSIPDTRLESFYWIQQYKMASATRIGALPIDLMGPWYRITPWPKYWWNLNAQLTYYPFFSSNHLSLVKPLTKMIDDHLGNLIKNAPEQYQYNSAALARSGPADMVSGIKVVKGNDNKNSSSSLELGDLPWLLHVYWQAYEYSMDKTVMESIYPVLVRSMNYYMNVMDKGADGRWHLPYTFSPEYPEGITRDANYDLALFRWGCETLLKINSELKKNDPLAVKWKDVLANLTPYPTDDLGFRIGRDASFTQSHRHYSHLLMVYPLYLVNWDQPENRELIKKSLQTWENNNSAWRGYSYTGSGSIYAMMGDGNKTYKLLNEMMVGRFAIKPNTMYLEAGPVIETPLSVVTTMNEILLQSWNGTLRIFPAVPDAWKEASFDKLRAKGAFLVSAFRKDGKTQFIKVQSLAGSKCLIKSDLGTNVQVKGKRAFKVSDKGNGVIELDLKKGEEAVIYRKGYTGSFTIIPANSDGKPNQWGLK